MKAHLLFSLLLFTPGLIAQPPGIAWQKCLGGSWVDRGWYLQQTTDGGYIVAGHTGSNDGDVSGWHEGYEDDGFGGLQPTLDMWVIKLNSVGGIVWQKCFGGSSNDMAYSIQQTSDGGYVVAGQTLSNDGDVSGNHGNGDYWIVKLTSSGGIEWQKCLGGADEDYVSSIQQSTDGGYIVAGHTISEDGDVSGSHGSWDIWVVKLNPGGGIDWQKSLGGSAAELAGSIQQTIDGGFIVAGLTGSNDGDVSGNNGSWDFWIVKLTSDGEIVWQKCLGGSDSEYAKSIQQTTDGGFIVAGRTASADGDVSGNHGSWDFWIVKLSSGGGMVWQKCLGGSDLDFAESIQQTTDGGFIVGGIAYSNDGDVSGNHGGADFWIVKLTSSGGTEWQKCLGGSGYDLAFSIHQLMEGGYIVAGYTESDNGDVSGNHGVPDVWIVNLDDSPCPVLNESGTFTNPLCFGSANGSINITPPTNGSAPYVYSWSNGAVTEDISGLIAGTYTLSVTDGSSCSSTLSFTLTDPTIIALTLTEQPVSCHAENDGALTVIPSGGSPGYTYQWSNGGSTNTISNLPSGSYTVTVTDSHNCVMTSTVQITDPPAVAGQIIAQPAACNEETGMAYISASGGTGVLAFLWSNGETTSMIDSLPAGAYAVTVSDENQCSVIMNVVVGSIDNTAPGIIQIADTLFVNETGIIEDFNPIADNFLDDCGPFTYEVLNAGDLSCAQQQQPDTLLIHVTDLSGNDTMYNLLITLRDTFPPAFISCPPNLEQGTCQGAVNFIDPVATDNCQLASMIQVSGLPSGVEFPVGITMNEWIATDNSGNTQSCSNVVEVTEGIVLGTEVQSISCHNENDGWITIDTSHLLPPYFILWNTGDTTVLIDSLGEGMYTVMVTDDNGCQALDTFVLTNPEFLFASLLEVHNPSSADSADGSISIQVFGGLPPYTYEWYFEGDSLVSTLQNPVGLGPGHYILILRDAHQCLFVGLPAEIIATANTDIVKNSFHLWPNPTRDIVEIQSAQTIDALNLLDYSGRIIYTRRDIGSNKIVISLAGQLPGIYALNLFPADERMGPISKWIVKME